jgi:protein-S-isoprenylcysteine O-methyltransferase Ste14
MNNSFYIILIHQIIFQGMFFAKNIYLRRKTGNQIKGKNIEAVLSTIFFVLFIAVSTIFAFTASTIGSFLIIDTSYSFIIASVLIFINMFIGATSLINMKDSWRVGVLEDQKTQLIEHGIYKFSRNPYFLSYIIMFIAYTVLLQNIILFVLSIVGILFINSMISKEEQYLLRIHRDSYIQYKKRVPRYFII